ncbi:sensor histidine kinase [Pedobacter insulae]|uniref:Histidine kinase n=1 Tax=Pedobacter insulae TaxID=414048 RepID=A0A1I2YCE8_9SPHI|nr:histidine kinase [Pedobacter insulae]SFH23265.1 Histidine kinase [Pedobacter insulae]
MSSNSTKPVTAIIRCVYMLLFFSISTGYAQHSTSYFEFEAKGVSGSQITTFTKGKTENVFTTGGYVNIYPTDAFKRTGDLNFHAYYHDKKEGKNFNGSLYLLPGKEYFIDVFEQSTQKLVKRYILRRPILFPKIKFYDHNHHFYTSKTDGIENELNLSPGEKIRLDIVQPMDFNDMEVELSLRNLKTKRIQRGSSKYNFKNLKFEANTAYELRFNYVAQKESVCTIYVKVKPYWYQSPITYVIFLILLTAIGILMLTITLKKKIRSTQNEQQKLEQAATRLQSLLNPHFTFNALSTVQGLMNTERIDEANQYLQEFSSLLRQTLTKSKQLYTTLDQELEMMRLYMKIEAFRFNFSWEITVSEALNPAELEIPTLLLQPLIENAIKHGLAKMGDQGKLQIVCAPGQKKNSFVIAVNDNGTWVNKHKTGYGLSLTEERIATVNKIKNGQKIMLHFEKQIGTSAILTFYNWIDKQ